MTGSEPFLRKAAINGDVMSSEDVPPLPPSLSISLSGVVCVCVCVRGSRCIGVSHF